MKYLLLDHAGVLSQALDDAGEVNEAVINKLNKLVQEYNYKILFHSSNNLLGQLELLNRLRQAALKKNLVFPSVEAIAVRDFLSYGNISSDSPQISNEAGIKIAAFGIKKPGKACIREALTVLLNITPAERAKSIVFDDDVAHIEQAQKEGYQTQYIGGPDNLTFDRALGTVLKEFQ